jgi:hypothetical protein
MSEAAVTTTSLPMADPPKEPHLRIQSDLVFRSFAMLLAVLTLGAAFGGFAVFGDVRKQITALVILLLVLLLAAVRMFVRGLSAAAFHRMNNEGLVQLSEGTLGDAARSFEDLAKRAKGPAVFSIVALYNLAYTELLRGRLDRAQAILAALERRPLSVFSKHLLQQGCAALQALIFSLQGNAEATRSWIAEAKKRQDDAKMTGYLILAEALAFVQERRFAEAESALESGWQSASASLGGIPYGGLRLLRAHVWQRLGRPPQAVYEMIAGAKPYRREELAYLRAASADLAHMVDENAEDMPAAALDPPEARS